MWRLARSLCLWLLWFDIGGLNEVRADDWYRWRGPRLNGISSETDWSCDWPPNGPPVAWKANVGTGFSSIVVCDGRLYTLGNTDDIDCVFCLDALTGTELWKFTYSASLDDRLFEGGPTSTPTVDGESVFTLSRQGVLYCFKRSSGELRWSKNIAEATDAPVPGWGFAGSPLAHDDLLLLNIGASGTAVNKASGAVVWQSTSGEAGYATPLAIKHSGRWLALFASGKQYSAVDIQTGNVKWQHRWLTTFGCNAADPIFNDGKIFISSGYNRGSALLELTDGSPKVVWTTKELQNQFSSSVLIGANLYGVDGNDTAERSIKCIELETGKVQWEKAGLGSASLMAAGDRLIILSDGGDLVIARAEPNSFQLLARAQVLSGKCWTVPVLSGGRIYCRSAAGEIVCVDVRPEFQRIP